MVVVFIVRTRASSSPSFSCYSVLPPQAPQAYVTYPVLLTADAQQPRTNRSRALSFMSYSQYASPLRSHALLVLIQTNTAVPSQVRVVLQEVYRGHSRTFAHCYCYTYSYSYAACTSTAAELACSYSGPTCQAYVQKLGRQRMTFIRYNEQCTATKLRRYVVCLPRSSTKVLLFACPQSTKP